ncbi:MAG: efflux RND transporter periplasmic adaptor subunit [Thermoanaerobaculales bacterium]
MPNTARIRWCVLAIAAALILVGVVAGCGKSPQADVRYHCPMHPTFISDKPGDCPICGMRLIPIEEKAAPTTVPAFTCPMHPEVTSDRPGRCSKCGMKLVPAGSTGDYPKEHKTYTCPVHPEFVTDDPNDRCPKCGRQVVERPSESREPVPQGVPVPAPQGPGGGRKLLFYRNPMNPKITSPVPMKDEMGMDYVPVYADEVAPAARPEHKILYYRSPMNPKITSLVPMKDEMGMDYVPVFADEVAQQSSPGVPGLAAVQLSQEGMRLAGVQTAPATEERLARTIRTVGTVTVDETRIQHFHTRVSGWVEKLYVNFTGQSVKQGEPVISIYSPELLASQEEFLRAREIAARFAASDLPEVRKGGEELLAAARRRLVLFDVPDEFIAELERTGKPQRAVTLVAHSSGYVTSKGIFHGQQVDPSMMDLFTITDLSHIWIDADFYEYEASLLRVGQEARLALPYDPAVRLTGRIAYVYPTLNSETRTVKVRFDFANPGLKLKPGMFANVELDTDGARGVVIPDSAIIDTGERQIAFVSLGGGRFEPRVVRIGVRSEGRALVLSGVTAGEQVVVKANFLLDSESQLRAAIAGASTATATPSSGSQSGGKNP